MINYISQNGFVDGSEGTERCGLAIRNTANITIVHSANTRPKKLFFKFFRSSGDWPNASIRILFNGKPVGKIQSKRIGTFSDEFELSDSQFQIRHKITLKIFPTGLFKHLAKVSSTITLQKYTSLVRDTLLLNQLSIDQDLVFSYNKMDRFNTSLKERKVQSPVRILGFFNQTFGLAEAARRTRNAISYTNIDMKLTQVPFTGKHSGIDSSVNSETKKLKKDIEEIRIFHFNGDHCDQLTDYWDTNLLKCKYSIGFWHWEQSEFPNDCLSWFEKVDEIWTPSSFVNQAISVKSPKPVQLIPLAYEKEILSPPMPDRTKFSIPQDKVIFLITFDFYSIIERKNPMSGILAFAKLITDKNMEKEAHLVVKTSNQHAHPNGTKILYEVLNAISPAKYTIIHDSLPREIMIQLLNSCDAMISLHRSEGFGLHLTEAMALGKIVIATNWSGNTDFMDSTNSFPVDYNLVELDNDVGSYKKGCIWAEPIIDHAVSVMKMIIFNKDHKLERIRFLAKETITKNHSPEKIGEIIENRIKFIEYHKNFSIKK